MPNSNIWALIAGHPDGQYGDVDGVGAAARFNSPRAIDTNVEGTKAWIADYGNNKVKELDISTGTVTTIGSFTEKPVYLTYCVTKNRLFVFFQPVLNKSNDISSVRIYDFATSTWITPNGTIPLQPGPFRFGMGFHLPIFGGTSRYHNNYVYNTTNEEFVFAGLTCRDDEKKAFHFINYFSDWSNVPVVVGLQNSAAFEYVSGTVRICCGDTNLVVAWRTCYNDPAPSVPHSIVDDFLTTQGYDPNGSISISPGPVIGGQRLWARCTPSGKLDGYWFDTIGNYFGKTHICTVNSPVHCVAWSEYLQSWLGVTHYGNWAESSFSQSGSTNGTGWNQVVSLGSPWVVGSVQVADPGLIVW